jgi:hypothetical protein
MGQVWNRSGAMHYCSGMIIHSRSIMNPSFGPNYYYYSASWGKLNTHPAKLSDAGGNLVVDDALSGFDV